MGIDTRTYVQMPFLDYPGMLFHVITFIEKELGSKLETLRGFPLPKDGRNYSWASVDFKYEGQYRSMNVSLSYDNSYESNWPKLFVKDMTIFTASLGGNNQAIDIMSRLALYLSKNMEDFKRNKMHREHIKDHDLKVYFQYNDCGDDPVLINETKEVWYVREYTQCGELSKQKGPFVTKDVARAFAFSYYGDQYSVDNSGMYYYRLINIKSMKEYEVNYETNK